MPKRTETKKRPKRTQVSLRGETYNKLKSRAAELGISIPKLLAQILAEAGFEDSE